MSRTLTLLVEVEQPDANWIWESHVDSKQINGCVVRIISEGDCIDLDAHEGEDDDDE